MKTWRFELTHYQYYIVVNYYERFNDYSVSLRTIMGYEVDFKCYKYKGAVNRYLNSWGLEERI